MSENIGGAQVCWKKVAECTSFTFEAGKDYRAVCGVATAYAYGSPDAFGCNRSPSQTIDEAYVDGISIPHSKTCQHIFAYVSAISQGSCPCKGGKPGPAFVDGNTCCEDQVLAKREEWKKQ